MEDNNPFNDLVNEFEGTVKVELFFIFANFLYIKIAEI